MNWIVETAGAWLLGFSVTGLLCLATERQTKAKYAKRYDELQKEKEYWEAQTKETRKDNAEISSDYTVLAGKYDELEAKYRELEAENVALKERNTDLVVENAEATRYQDQAWRWKGKDVRSLGGFDWNGKTYVCIEPQGKGLTPHYVRRDAKELEGPLG